MARKIPDVLTETEFKKILDETQSPKHRLAYLLGYFCGLRVSEVVKLQPDDVLRGEGVLHIRQAKGHKDRKVPYHKGLVKHFSILPLGIGARTLQIAFLRAAKRAGIKKNYLKFHCLRHSYATNYRNKGGDMKNLQLNLGHASISTTMDIYTHTTVEDRKKEYDRMFEK